MQMNRMQQMSQDWCCCKVEQECFAATNQVEESQVQLTRRLRQR
jgi:hypothetical protein